ncbi:MAG: tRNA (guanosine(46)-N7)-methyltransferase TrmB [Bacteroidota bacterium]
MPKNKLKRWAKVEDLPNFLDCDTYLERKKPYPKEQWNTEEFGNPNPITLELACGKGEYSIGMAGLYPERNFVGVDIKGHRMFVGAEQAIEQELPNVRFLRAFIDHLDHYFGKGEVNEIWIIFPDPYLRKARKRLTSPKFLNLYRTFCHPECTINLKTDSIELYEYTHQVIRDERLSILRDVGDIYKDTPDDSLLTIQTFYEQMHLEAGKQSKFISFRLNPDS